jgi:hypothetical protein
MKKFLIWIFMFISTTVSAQELGIYCPCKSFEDCADRADNYSGGNGFSKHRKVNLIKFEFNDKNGEPCTSTCTFQLLTHEYWSDNRVCGHKNEECQLVCAG